jgi:ATP-dependent DNA helicase HFM1/MER3
MCEPELVKKYKALTQGETVLESCLHLNLAEHLNSEVVLGTISSLRAATYAPIFPRLLYD